jgi:glycosyltransferase involved in cell wall biosynthesis
MTSQQVPEGERCTGLRVLMVSPFPRAGLANGGVAAAVETLALELSARRDVEAIEIVNLRRDITRHEVTVINPKLRVHHLPGQRRAALPTRSWWDYVRTRRIARRFRPDIVHGQGVFSEGDIATRLGFPSVVTIHGMPHIEARAREKAPVLGGLRVFLIERLVRRTLDRARMVISISDYDQGVLGNYVSGSVVRIPNAVREAVFGSEPPPPGHRILFAGSLIPRKNVAGIVRAFGKVRAAVPGASLELAGFAPDPGYAGQIAAEIRKLATASIVYLGNLASDKLSAALKQAAVVVLFSEQETLPCIVAEAMASSRAVVSSNVGAVREMVVDGDTGLLVDPGDEDGLATCLIRLLQNPGLTRMMGERGHALARASWSAAQVVDETLNAYRALLRSEPPPA